MWKFSIYADLQGQWRWRLLAKNGKVVADGAEGYASKSNVVKAVRRFMKQMVNADRFLVAEE